MSALNKLRQRAIAALREDIEAIDPNDLETLAHGLVQIIEGRPLIQRGLTVTGRPVGYTVDSFSADQNVIIECSAETGYFEKPFLKLIGDIAHARATNPICQRLFLFSSETCPNSNGAPVGAVIRQEAFGECVIEWYDARRIAEAIFDHVIVNDNRREFFEEFLPSLSRLFADYVFSNAAPSIPKDLVVDALRGTAISQALTTNQIVNLFDLSGAGKTYAAIAFAADHEDDFSGTFWVRGEDIGDVTDFRMVRLQRSGVAMNLASVLRTTPCLLVIDNCTIDGARLKALLPPDLNPGARILTTALHALGGLVHDLELPALSADAARAVLHRGTHHPTVEQAGEIVRFTRGHPLILAILRDTVDETGTTWDAIIADIKTNLAIYESRDHQTILDRILVRHSAGIVDELLILKWLGTPLLDSEFAESVLGIAGVAKLRRRSILRPAGMGQLKIHDLIVECLKHFSVAGSPGLSPSDRFWSYFRGTWEVSPYHFQRALHLHRKQIAAACDPKLPQPDLPAYLALLLEDCPLTPEGVARLAATDMRLYLRDRAALGAIIEAVERRIKLAGGGWENESLLRDAIQQLSEALSLATEPVIRADLLHHRGKFRHWLKDGPGAISDFTAVLELFPDHWAALVQLARVKADRSAGDYLKRIIDAFEKSPATIPTTIILAALNELGSSVHAPLRTEVVRNRIAVVQTAISLSLVAGYSQPYRMLGRLGRHIFFPHPDVLLQLAGAVTFPPVEIATNDEVFDIAECLKCIGKAHREAQAEPDVVHSWWRQAIQYYERVPSPNGFQLTMYGECCMLLRDFSGANQLLERVPNANREAHWWHRKAQVLLGLGQADEGLAALEHSFADPKAATYLGTFLQTKARILAAKGDPTCVESARLAFSLVNDEKHKQQIADELRDYQSRFAP